MHLQVSCIQLHGVLRSLTFHETESVLMIEFGIGILAGVLLTGVVAWLVLPGMMLEIRESPYDTVEETCDRLADTIEDKGWSNQAVRDMNASMAKRGVEMDRPVRVVELCNANHAKAVLNASPEVSTMMPCAWGVYEGEDGNVYVSGMNMGLMGQMFGGTIAEVMGGTVAEDEEEMLDEALSRKAHARSTHSLREPDASRGAPQGDGAMSDASTDLDAADDASHTAR